MVDKLRMFRETGDLRLAPSDDSDEAMPTPRTGKRAKAGANVSPGPSHRTIRSQYVQSTSLQVHFLRDETRHFFSGRFQNRHFCTETATKKVADSETATLDLRVADLAGALFIHA
jgi:hypothetical protein